MLLAAAGSDTRGLPCVQLVPEQVPEPPAPLLESDEAEAERGHAVLNHVVRAVVRDVDFEYVETLAVGAAASSR